MKLHYGDLVDGKALPLHFKHVSFLNCGKLKVLRTSRFFLMISGTSLIQILSEVKPTEIYNLGAMSHVKISFQTAEYTADVDGVGTLRLLEAIRTVGMNDKEFLKNVREMSLCCL